MEQLKRAAKITFRCLEDFFMEAKKRSIRQVFRNWGHRDESHTATYTGWDEGGVFLRGEICFPELKKLMQDLPDRRYGTPWEVTEGGQLVIKSDNKTSFVKDLQVLGVEDVREFRKLTIENIRGLIDEGTEDEDRETHYRRGGIFQKKMPCSALGGMVKELSVRIEVSDRRDVNYKIYLGEWVSVVRQLEQRYEQCFREADIRVISGEVELV